METDEGERFMYEIMRNSITFFLPSDTPKNKKKNAEPRPEKGQTEKGIIKKKKLYRGISTFGVSVNPYFTSPLSKAISMKGRDERQNA
jgi:hypothetical protein